MRYEGHMWVGIGNGVMAGALWGLVFLTPLLLPGFSSAQLAAARYLVYGAFALALLGPRWRQLPRLDRPAWWALVWLSLLGNIVYYVFLAQAVHLAGGAATSLIVGLLPVIISLVGAREAGAVSARSLGLPLLLCCVGVVAIAFDALRADGARSDNVHRIVGLACAFGALASWSIYAIGNSRWLARLPHISAHDWALLTGVVTGAQAVVLSAFVFPSTGSLHTAGQWGYFWGVNTALAFLASIVGNRCWNQASRLLPLTLTGQMITFETLFALLYSFLWAHRLPTSLETLAILCLIVGIAWCAAMHRADRAESAA
jgi:drug/metabolite transporter (DMT)-like permease